jgi:hypothetical protein
LDYRVPVVPEALVQRIAALVLVSAMALAACSTAAAPTPQIIYVTPVPSVAPSPVATASATPTGNEAHAPAGTYMAGGICYLVTNDEIAAVIGRAPLLGGGSGFELGGVRYCNWVTYADPVEGAGLTLNSATNHETGRIMSPETVAGLGDDAYWLPPPLGQLSVQVGQYNLTVSVTSKQVDEKAAAIQIARDALSRLR